MRIDSLIKNLKVKTKLGLVIICMIIPIVSLVVFLFAIQQREIRRDRLKIDGVDYVDKAMKVVNFLSQSYNFQLIYSLGEEGLKKNINNLYNNIDIEFASIKELTIDPDSSFKNEKKLTEPYKSWKAVRQNWLEYGHVPKFETISKIQFDILEMVQGVIEESRLRLDTNSKMSILSDVLINDISSITSNIIKLQSLEKDDVLGRLSANKEQDNIKKAISDLEKSIEKTSASFSILADAFPSLYRHIDSLIQEADTNAKIILKFSLDLMESEVIKSEPSEYFKSLNKFLQNLNQLTLSINNSLRNILQERVSSEIASRNMQLLVAVLLSTLAILISIVTYRYITSQISAISKVFNQIDKGDFEARSEVLTNDELGMVAISLNDMLDRALSLIQSQDERDAIQESIMKLLDEVSDVAKGDLTVEAEVTEDITGAIADSFNHMIYQLRQIVRNVQNATLQVSSSATYIQETAEKLADGSSTQAEQIIDSSAALDEMAVSIQQVSENASLSSTVAEQALENAKQGAKAVQNTIQGMQRIRTQVQETAKRIKRLGERSQEISEIVQLIGDIADRTSILALNASIQAARAGEAGRSFAVVAEEVERLAERSTNATKQIASLVNTIQSETNEAVIAMEESTHEVVEGSQVADQAGQALNEIESVSSRLAGLIQSISLASTQQARGSDNLSKAMNEISEVTQHTANGTKQTADAISQLAFLADELRNSVSTFKLPISSNQDIIDK